MQISSRACQNHCTLLERDTSYVQTNYQFQCNNVGGSRIDDRMPDMCHRDAVLHNYHFPNRHCPTIQAPAQKFPRVKINWFYLVLSSGFAEQLERQRWQFWLSPFPPPIHFIHVSLASLLIVVSTQDNVCNSVSLYATIFLVIDLINVMMSMNETADFREGHIID